MIHKRGLVLPSELRFFFDGSGTPRLCARIDRQELRSDLLFWDNLNIPLTNGFKVELGPEEQFLLDAGILVTAERQHAGGSLYSAFWQAQVDAFLSLDAANPGTWSLATGERAPPLPERNLVPNRGLLVRLHHAIPVPDKEVPLADILEFKERRQSELLTLRYHLERIYQRLISAGDGELAFKTEFESLQLALGDHIKAMRAPGFRLRLSDLSASINLLPGVVAGSTAFATGLPLVQSLITGAGACTLSVSTGAALKGRKVNETPFKYVTSYSRELFR